MQHIRAHAPSAPVRRIALIGLVIHLLSSSVWATLGQPLPAGTATTPVYSTGSAHASSAVTRQAQAVGAASVQYSVLTTALDGGTQVSEYVNPTGTVFAISWQGPVMPNLELLLGTYFPAFTQAAQANRPGRSVGTPLRIQTDNLIVQSTRQMRSFSGYAYAPALLPNGLLITDVLP